MALKTEPIGEDDLDEVSDFLNRNLNSRISTQAWRQSLIHPWCDERPNYGALLRDGADLVGVFCAIYSDQDIEGRIERFCNPHSWCVLPAYRKQGVGLAMYLIKQRGYHFTMLTPNPNVAEIFRNLRFKMLEDGMLVFPNLPMLSLLLSSPDVVIETEPRSILDQLSGSIRRDLELHRDISWLRFVAFGKRDDLCLIAYKTARWKKLPSARVIYVSDAPAFDRHVRILQHHMLIHRGIATTHVEQRFVGRGRALAMRGRRTQAKLYLSATLNDSQIRDFYTELVALDV